jgi:hypothetical protein
MILTGGKYTAIVVFAKVKSLHHHELRYPIWMMKVSSLAMKEKRHEERFIWLDLDY